MIKKVNRIAQWTAKLLLCAWGVVSFIFLAGEENPDTPLSLCNFIVIKTIAMTSFLLCLYVCKRLYRTGRLQEYNHNNKNYGMHNTKGVK